MKAHREEPKQPFVPVTLTLETQEEVDAIFALLNHTIISDAVRLPYCVYMTLKQYASPRYNGLHANLDQILK